jgi:hypothetical protein
MSKKRGAIELSISTIVVVVIGITLLTLGLIFVRGVFKKITGTTEEAFEQARGEIGRIVGVDSLLTIAPGEIELERTSSQTVKIVIANFGSEQISAKVTSTSSDQTYLECLFADTFKSTSNNYNIASGEQVTVKLIVQEKGGNLGTKICNLVVSGTGISGDNQDSLIINVIKKQGFFG